jgi:hypothetical protein
VDGAAVCTTGGGPLVGESVRETGLVGATGATGLVGTVGVVGTTATGANDAAVGTEGGSWLPKALGTAVCCGSSVKSVPFVSTSVVGARDASGSNVELGAGKGAMETLGTKLLGSSCPYATLVIKRHARRSLWKENVVLIVIAVFVMVVLLLIVLLNE